MTERKNPKIKVSLIDILIDYKKIQLINQK